jgi:hypothetical protein
MQQTLVVWLAVITNTWNHKQVARTQSEILSSSEVFALFHTVDAAMLIYTENSHIHEYTVI